MPAPTIANLLDYETNIQDAFASYLAIAFPDCQILTPRTSPFDEDRLRTPRYELSLAVTGTGSAEHDRITDGKVYESTKTGSLAIRAVAQRAVIDQSLGRLRGQLRNALLPATLAVGAADLPYYELTHIQETGCSPQSFAGNEEIISDLTWSLSWFIKPDQWPVS